MYEKFRNCWNPCRQAAKNGHTSQLQQQGEQQQTHKVGKKTGGDRSMIVQVDRTVDRTVDQSNSSSVSQLGLGLQKLPTNDRMFPRAGHQERGEGPRRGGEGRARVRRIVAGRQKEGNH